MRSNLFMGKVEAVPVGEPTLQLCFLRWRQFRLSHAGIEDHFNFSDDHISLLWRERFHALDHEVQFGHAGIVADEQAPRHA